MNLSKWVGKNWWRLLVSAFWDFLDFTLGRLPVAGLLMDLFQPFIGVFLWGKTGWLAALEIGDLTDQIDGFVPSLTIIGLWRMYVETG